MRNLLLAVALLGACDEKTNTEGSPPKPVLSKSDELIIDIQHRIGSEQLATVSIKGSSVVLDARKGQDECRAMMSVVDLRFRHQLHEAGIKSIRCVTTKFEDSIEVGPK